MLEIQLRYNNKVLIIDVISQVRTKNVLKKYRKCIRCTTIKIWV